MVCGKKPFLCLVVLAFSALSGVDDEVPKGRAGQQVDAVLTVCCGLWSVSFGGKQTLMDEQRPDWIITPIMISEAASTASLACLQFELL